MLVENKGEKEMCQKIKSILCIIISIMIFFNSYAIAENKKVIVKTDKKVEKKIVTEKTDKKVTVKTDKKKNGKITPVKKVKKKNGKVYSFLGFFKFKDVDSPKIQFEIGMLAYSTNSPYWDLVRMEPFVKMHWAILDKYLQPYILFSIDSSKLNYKITDWDLGYSKLSMNLKLKSSGNPSLGGGLKIFLLGWRRLNIYAYMQMQMSSLNDASTDEANLKLNNTNFNIFDLVNNHIDINYNIKRYDVGMTFSYQLFSWLQLYSSMGYILFDVTIKINTDDYLISTLNTLTHIDPSELIPKRLSMKASGFLGILGMKFRIYKRLYLNIEGTIVPGDNPIYFGQFSLVVQGAS